MAAETGQSHPANRKLGVIILGASTYPHFPSTRKLDNASFARSAAAFHGLMADEGVSVFGKPTILDLFDVGDDPTSIIRQIKKFIGSEPALTDVLFYYCGHGDFLSDRTYYLTLKVTEPENEAFTVLPLRQMRLALATQLMTKRVFLVLDCCFSGHAAKEWMAAGIGHVIEEQVFHSFPKRGTALIAASARSGPAIAPERESLTMFTGALINTVSNGVASEKRELSFRDIVDQVRARISDIYGSAGVAPEIHAPCQDEGDITFTPFFVNRAFVAPPETRAEREDFEFAVADLDRLSPKTRIAAVETLKELLLSAQSVAFRVEILNKLRTVKENDDSQRVRTKCGEILADWGEHSHEINSPPLPQKLVGPAEPQLHEREFRDDGVRFLKGVFVKWHTPKPSPDPDIDPRVTPPIVDPQNKIDESKKPKTFALFSRSPTGTFLKYFILSIAVPWGTLWPIYNRPAEAPRPFQFIVFFAGFIFSIFSVYYFKRIERIEGVSVLHKIVLSVTLTIGLLIGALNGLILYVVILGR